MNDGLKTWICVICGHIYEEAKGDPDRGVAPGTRWAGRTGGLELPRLRGQQGRFRTDGVLARQALRGRRRGGVDPFDCRLDAAGGVPSGTSR